MWKNPLIGLAVLGVACVSAALAGAQTTGTNSQSTVVYVARLLPLNTKVTALKATGEARFTVAGDTLTITIKVEGVPPGIIHWQHFHGFKDNREATCPTEAADANHDGIVDIVETGPMSGTTMVPFDDDPAGMQIARGIYPEASADGTLQYQKKVSLKALEAAFVKASGDQDLDLDRRVVFLHGVSAVTKLPASVASLGNIPAQVTLPIACGKIERVGQ